MNMSDLEEHQCLKAIMVDIDNRLIQKYIQIPMVWEDLLLGMLTKKN